MENRDEANGEDSSEISPSSTSSTSTSSDSPDQCSGRFAFGTLPSEMQELIFRHSTLSMRVSFFHLNKTMRNRVRKLGLLSHLRCKELTVTFGDVSQMTAHKQYTATRPLICIIDGDESKPAAYVLIGSKRGDFFEGKYIWQKDLSMATRSLIVSNLHPDVLKVNLRLKDCRGVECCVESAKSLNKNGGIQKVRDWVPFMPGLKQFQFFGFTSDVINFIYKFFYASRLAIPKVIGKTSSIREWWIDKIHRLPIVRYQMTTDFVLFKREVQILMNDQQRTEFSVLFKSLLDFRDNIVELLSRRGYSEDLEKQTNSDSGTELSSQRKVLVNDCDIIKKLRLARKKYIQMQRRKSNGDIERICFYKLETTSRCLVISVEKHYDTKMNAHKMPTNVQAFEPGLNDNAPTSSASIKYRMTGLRGDPESHTTTLHELSTNASLSDSDATTVLTLHQDIIKATRSRATPSLSFSPVDTSIINSLDICRDMITILSRAASGIDLLRNRSDKDKTRIDLLNSVITRLRILETDLSQLITDPAYERKDDDLLPNGFTPAVGHRAGTLSVLSDDSFMSAIDDLGDTFAEDHEEIYNFDKTSMEFLQEGMVAALNGQVHIRKNRADICQCENDTDFAAKLYCLRKALNIISTDEKKRLWLSRSGRQLIGGLLKHCRQEPDVFYKTFDELLGFMESEENQKNAEEELKSRNVLELGIWDVLMDFILLDAFEDLKNPPSAVYSVTKNSWLSESMKYSTISTVIWSMLKVKRQRLTQQNGFIAYFYNISEAVSPALTLGFLGTNEKQKELCHFFKDQVVQLAVQIFDEKRVRYTSVDDLAGDVWVAIEERTETLLVQIAGEAL